MQYWTRPFCHVYLCDRLDQNTRHSKSLPNDRGTRCITVQVKESGVGALVARGYLPSGAEGRERQTQFDALYRETRLRLLQQDMSGLTI